MSVINQVNFFSVLLWESLSSENLVAMFFFCNTHYVVAGAQFLWRGWIWICCSVHSPDGVTDRAESIHPFTSPPWPGWMNDGVALWWPGAGWLTDGLLMWWRNAAGPVQRRSHQRRSRKRSRSFEDDDEGHLIYRSGDILRARCIEYTPFFFSFCWSHFVSLTLLLSGFCSQALILGWSIWANRLNCFWLDIACHYISIISNELYASVEMPVIVKQSNVTSGSEAAKGNCWFCHCFGSNFNSLFSVDEIVCTLGEGAFGKVVECIDHNK